MPMLIGSLSLRSTVRTAAGNLSCLGISPRHATSDPSHVEVLDFAQKCEGDEFPQLSHRNLES